MKKLINLLLVVITSLILASCNSTIEDNTFSVVFYTGPGASVVKTIYNLNPGDKITKPADPTSDGGEFVDWFKDADYSEKWEFDTDLVTKSMTLFAKWEQRVYTISYDLRGGVWPDGLGENIYPTSYTYSTSKNFTTKNAEFPKYPRDNPDNPFKGLFLGWWTEADLTASQRRDIPKTEGIVKGTTGDITFYAYYSQDK